MRSPWIAAAVVVGAAAGLAVAAGESPSYRATVTFVVAPSLRSTAPGVPTLTRTAAALVRSRSVAENVVGALGLHESPDHLLQEIAVHTEPGTAIVRVGVRQGSKLDARRVAQQVLVVFEGLANSRLGRQGGGPAVAVWDPAGDSATRAGHPYAADAAGGAVVGLLLGVFGVLGLRRRVRAPRLPERRVRAASPAPALPAEPPAPPERAPQPEAEPEPEPQAAPVAEEPASERVPAPAVGVLAELERRTAAEADPNRHQELALYLEQLRAFAASDGSLPPNLIGLAEEVFGEL